MKRNQAVWSVLLNVILPGLGHAMYGNFSVGLTLACAYSGLVALIATSDAAIYENLGLLILAGLVWVIALCDSVSHPQRSTVFTPLFVHYLDPDAQARISGYLGQAALVMPPVKVYCFGCNEYPGDSFGPAVGTLLKNLGHPNIFGTDNEPLDAVHLAALDLPADESSIIAIDAAIADTWEREGMIVLLPGGLNPGSSLGRSLPTIGVFSVLFAASHKVDAEHPLAEFLDPVSQERSVYAARIVAGALDEYLRSHCRRQTAPPG